MHLLVSLCFFFSGLSGLCFEIVWTKQLEHLLGTSSLAVSSVVTSYMAGLALGSFLTGRLQTRLKRPLVGYALCEAGIACFGLLIPWLVGLYPGLYRALWGAWYGESFYLFSLFRFVLVLLTLLGPTTLMGATLPLLVKFFTARLAGGDSSNLQMGRCTARLYTVNLAGAFVGTLCAGFWFLPTIGLRATTWVAVSINFSLPLLLALGSFLSKRNQDADKEELASLLAQESAALEPRAGRLAIPLFEGQKALVRLFFGFSGALSMAYQMFWTRALVIVLGASVYAFTLILSCFLFGLFLGGAVGAWSLSRIRRPLLALGVAHLMVALLSYGTARYLDQLPRVFIELLTFAPDDLWQALSAGLLVSALVLLLPACFLGAIFPITIRLISADTHQKTSEEAAREVGSAYAANTLGAILGAFSGGFLLLPWFGLARSLYGGVLCSGLLGAGSLLLLRPQELRASWRFSVASLGVIGGLVLFAPSWDVGRLNEGLFRPTVARTAIEEGDFVPPDKILFYRDSITTTVSLEDLGGVLALKVNGKVDASSGSDMPTQIMAGSLALALHSEVTSRDLAVAVVGYGSGVTVGAALQFPVRQVDVIEIEPAVVEAAKFFGRYNHDAHQDPRLRVYYDDGRNFLQATATQYDVIISEPSNPWLAGVASLFTEEFFASVKARLRPNGVFLQWLQLYEISPQSIQLVLRTFHASFPQGMVFCAGPYSPDLLLVALPQGQKISPEALERLWHLPRVAAELQRAKLNHPYDLMSLLLAGGAELAQWVGEGRLNNDDNGALEFSAPRDMLLSSASGGLISEFYDEFFESNQENLRLDSWFSWSGVEATRRAQQAKLAQALARIGRLRAALRFADRAEGLLVGISSVEKPLGPARAGPFAGGLWWRASAWARVMVIFLYYRDQEGVPLPTSIASKEDLEALQQHIFSAQRNSQTLHPDATLEEHQAPWREPFDFLLALENQKKLNINAEAEVLRGILAYKVGAFFPASEAFSRAVRQDLSLRHTYPQLSYFWAKAQFALSDYDRVTEELAWYLAASESPFAVSLRTLLEPQP
jgi:spermidine synthase